MKTTRHPAEWLIAHRGWPARFPENSLEGIRAVLEAGARRVEFDVQLTADHRPVVIHDDDLRRLTGNAGRITDMNFDQLDRIRVGTEGSRRAGISTLEQVLAVFDDHPDATAFVELKRHSIRRLGRATAVDAVMDRIRRARCRSVILSFDAAAAALARERGADAIGWVFRPWTRVAKWRARRLRPDYLFIRADRVPRRTRPFWTGNWQWVIYGIEDLAGARRFLERGADLIEVNDLPALLAAAQGGHDA